MTSQSSNGSLLQWLRAQRPMLVFAALAGAVGLLFYALVFARHKSADDISVVYGQRNSGDGRLSINGTAVLAEMFEDAGFRVSSWNRLSPKLHRAKVIIWTPDDFAVPTPEQRQWLEDWLSEDSYRRLVYIGRDYDAELDYWRKTGARAPVEQSAEIDRRIARKKAAQDNPERTFSVSPKAAPYDETDAEWFTKEQEPNSMKLGRRPSKLSGPWSEGVHAEIAELRLNTLLRAPENEEPDPAAQKNKYEYDFGYDYDFEVDPGPLFAEVLLRVDDDEFVTRLTRDDWWEGEILVVANGSFLLNMPLVNSEHRKLAGKLIDECGEPDKLVFLESGVGGPPIRKNDDSNRLTGLEMLFVAPLNVILLHFLAMGVVLLVCYFPIFGRPR